MLTIAGRATSGRFCDGISRRSFLQIGALGMGGLALPQLLRAEAKAPRKATQKSVIMIYLPGGPPHQDFFDLKPNAPVEYRGEFQPISTKVPGIQIGELFPKMAQVMDKLVVVRSIVGSVGDHYAFQCNTGRSHQKQPVGGWPCMGAVLSKLKGSSAQAAPPFVSLTGKVDFTPWGDSGQPGFLGAAHSAFRPSGEASTDLQLQGVSLDRLRSRRALLKSFDRFRRDADDSGMMSGMDSFERQAMGVLTSNRLADALDVSKEDPRVVAAYGKGNPQRLYDGAPRITEQFLVVRRLVEAGVRFVTLAFGRWDFHARCCADGREEAPRLDQAVTALVNDLYERGLDKDVSVIIWGEFGRTPIINKHGGRDHWPAVNCALMSGGGMRTGQVIGATDRLGGQVVERPIKFGDVFATLYHNLGIDVNQVTIPDLAGRPQYLVDSGSQPIRELI